MSKLQLLTKGIIRENPTFVLLLGMCPTLGTTTSAVNGMGMGLATLFVLTLSNVVISLVKNLIPAQVRIPSFIVVIAAFVTVVQLCMEAYTPDLYNTLGVYIPLIVVNCIILGRAEAYALGAKPIPALFDGIGMGLGFTLALGILGAVREIIGSGAIFGYQFWDTPIGIFALAPGAFFVLAVLVIIQNKAKMKSGKKPEEKSCDGNCAGCMTKCEEINKKAEGEQ